MCAYTLAWWGCKALHGVRYGVSLSCPSTQSLTFLYPKQETLPALRKEGVFCLSCVSAEAHALPVRVLTRDRKPLAITSDHCGKQKHLLRIRDTGEEVHPMVPASSVTTS